MGREWKFAPWNRDFGFSVLYSGVSIFCMVYAGFLFFQEGDLSFTDIAKITVLVLLGGVTNRLSASRIASGERRLFGIEVERNHVPVLADLAQKRGWKVHCDVAVEGKRENIDVVLEKGGKQYVVEIKSMKSFGKIRSMRKKYRKQVLRQVSMVGANGGVLWYPLADDYFEDICGVAEIGGSAGGIIEAIENYDEHVKKHRLFIENIRFPDIFALDYFECYRDVLRRAGLEYQREIGWHGTVGYDAKKEIDRVCNHVAQVFNIHPQRVSVEKVILE